MSNVKQYMRILVKAFESLKNDQYSKLELDAFMNESWSYLSDKSKKNYQSKVMNVLFNKKGNVYTQNKLVYELIRENPRNLDIIGEYLFNGKKMDFKVIEYKADLFLWVIKQLPYGYIPFLKFLELVQGFLDNFDYFEFDDMLNKFRGKKLDWNNRCGLNQIIVYKENE